MNALNVLCVQLTRDLFAISKLLLDNCLNVKSQSPLSYTQPSSPGCAQFCHARRFSFQFFTFICSFRVVDKAGYPSAFYCALNTQYRIELYRTVT